jgi:hypothetical protein
MASTMVGRSREISPALQHTPQMQHSARGDSMGALARFALSTAVILIALPSAQGASLSVVSVAAPGINCIYDPSCRVMATDTVAGIPMAGISGRAVLQTRTFAAAADAPGAGKFGYEYRVNLTGAVGHACVTALKLPFGAIEKLPYNQGGPYGDIYVITSGGLGTIGFAGVEKAGDTIVFTFSKPVCAGAKPGEGESSLFFGLSSSSPPKPVTAQIDVRGAENVSVPARAAPAAEEPKPRSRSSGRRAPRRKNP